MHFLGLGPGHINCWIRQFIVPGTQRDSTLYLEINVRNFYRTQVSLGSGLWVPVSLTPSKSFAKLYYVTLADDDTNSILADDANRAI